MTRILLVRHAETDVMLQKLCGRTPGIPLNEAGRASAARLGTALIHENLEAVYSSPMERAVETASYVGQPIARPAFNEIDFGEWTGKTFTELQSDAVWKEYNLKRSSVTPPAGESPSGVLDRAWREMQELALYHRNATVAIVTHADVIRSLLTRLLGMSLDDLLRLEIAPASVSEVSIGGAYPVVHRTNRTFPQLKLAS